MAEWDLWIAFSVMSAVAIFAFFAGRKISSTSPSVVFLFANTVLLALVSSLAWHANLSWAKAIPASAVVLWSNLTPIVLAFAAGVAGNTPALRRWSRPGTAFTLGVLAVAFLITPILRPVFDPPTVAEEGLSRGLVCLQSHDSTCAPASAATLLRLNGIPSSEQEMVGPCLTSRQGTEALGLFRGLKIGSRNHHRQVRIAAPDPATWVTSQQLPNLALVHFPQDEFGPIGSTQTPRRYLGRRTDDGHAIVVIGYENGRWTVADPAIGLVNWSDEELRSRFTGEAIYLSGR